MTPLCRLRSGNNISILRMCRRGYRLTLSKRLHTGAKNIALGFVVWKCRRFKPHGLEYGLAAAGKQEFDVYMSKIYFQPQNALPNRSRSGLQRAGLRNTQPRKGTETKYLVYKIRHQLIKKHTTPKGDGNTFAIKVESASNFIKKHTTPKGDGNHYHTLKKHWYPVN